MSIRLTRAPTAFITITLGVILLSGAANAWGQTDGDTCIEAIVGPGGLDGQYIFNPSTIGFADDYNLSGEASPCAAGGSQQPSTGIGPDTVIQIRTDAECAITAGASDIFYPPVDFSLYVVRDCGDLANTCEAVSDSSDEWESVSFTALTDVDYYIIVDSPQETTFFMVIEHDGCSLYSGPGSVLFVDGFDSGDLSAWSSECPPDCDP